MFGLKVYGTLIPLEIKKIWVKNESGKPIEKFGFKSSRDLIPLTNRELKGKAF